MRPIQKALIVGLSTCCLLNAGAQRTTKTERASTYEPKTLKIALYGFDSRRVEWSGKTLQLTLIGVGETPRKITKTITPSVKAWKRFWKQMEEVKVWQWQPKYVAVGVADGEGWSLEIQQAGKHGRAVKSEGANSYPSDRDVTRPTSDESAPTQRPVDEGRSKVFNQMIAAVRDLLGKEALY